jgi:RHS repeat-associated protein
VTVDYLYDLADHAVTELSSSGGWNRGELYVAGRHVATYSGGTNGTTNFSHTDWLGTERVRSSVTGVACETITSLAYGDGQATGGSCGDPSPLHFTGKQRDGETGLDEFPARYYSSTQGRWLSPDWSPVPVAIPYANLSDPRTLNLYAYVGDDPTNHPDADGHVEGAGATPPPRPPCGLGDACEGDGPSRPPPSGNEASILQDPAKQGELAQDTPPAQMSSLQFFGAEVKGVWDSTGGALLGLGASLLSGEGEKNIATTAEWAVTSPGKIGEAVKEAGHEALQTVESAASGNPRAIGQVVGTAASVAYTAENVRVGPYKHGGGGANLKNTPFNGNRLAVDYHPFGKAGTATSLKNVLHLDIKIQQLGISLRHWMPW